MVKENTMKQTEIGFLPEDWEVVELGNVLKFGSGRDYKHLTIGDVPVFGTGGIMNFVDDFLYDGNSVGIGRKGTIDKPVYLTGKFWTVDTLFYTFAFQRTLPKYIYYQFGRVPWKEYNEASGVPSLNKNTLVQIQIPLPPLPEQHAIAEALSDADAWIESLEKLIAKKRLIKQGAMQELLTPKDDWEVKKLGEVAEYRRGSFPQPYGLDKWYDETNGMPFIQVFDVAKNRKLKPDTKSKISELAQPMSVFVPKNTIVLTLQGSIGRIALTQYDAYCDRTLLIFQKINSTLDKFFFLIQVEQIFDAEKERAPGGTIKTITKEALSDFDILFPTSLIEQTHIATILSDMDAELEALETQLAKARQVKQGMMQELLTGRTRLV